MGKILTLGNFDLLHEGHINLLTKICNDYGEENLVIAVSSDIWNRSKGKLVFQSENTRMYNIQSIFPNSIVTLENPTHDYGDLKTLSERYNIDKLILGEDHKKRLKLIKDKFNKKIQFFKRTPNISSTSKREQLTIEKFIYVNKKEIEKINPFLIIDYFETFDLDNLDTFFKLNSLPIKYLTNLNKRSKTDNSIWLFNNYVYKIVSSFNKKDILSYELNNLNNIPTIKTKKGIVYRFLEGVTLNNVNINEEIIFKVSQSIKSLNYKGIDNIVHRDFHSYFIDEEKFKLLDLESSYFKKYKYLYNTITTENDLFFAHGDLNLKNILFFDEEIFLIDFELARMTIRNFDLFNFYIHSDIDFERLIFLLKINNLDYTDSYKKIVILLLDDAYSNVSKGMANKNDKRISYGFKQVDKFKRMMKFANENKYSFRF